MYVPTISDWTLTLTVLFNCYNVGNVSRSKWLDNYHTSPTLTDKSGPNFGIKIKEYPYQWLSQYFDKIKNFWKLWYFDEIKRNFMKSFFHYCCKKTLIDFHLGSSYDPFCHCSWEVQVFFLEQEPPRSFLPNGVKILSLAHETSQNLIRICQFVAILL